MKIGIDTIGSDHGRSGIGAYVLSLVQNLPREDDIKYELFGSEVDRYTFTSGDDKASYKGLNLPDSISGERLWHMFILKKFIQKENYDAVLFTAGSRVLPRKLNLPTVAVVNSVVSEVLKTKNDLWSSNILLSSLKRMTKIISASMFIRKDLISLGIAAEKIEIVHNGIDHTRFYPRTYENRDTVLIKPFSIKRPYIIYASRLNHKSKKHIELIRAFSEFKKNTGLPHRLVLAGADGEYSEKVHIEAAESAYSADIFLTGYFPHQNLPELYSCADACVFPSVMEGVGLPVLEAMASGIPVAVAKAGSLSEIAGDGALYFDPDNVKDFSCAIERILTDSLLRETLVTFSKEWVKRFSWKKTAEKTVAIVQKTLKEYGKMT